MCGFLAHPVVCVKIDAACLAVDVLKTPQKTAKSTLAQRGAKSRMRRNETAHPIWIKFCLLVGIPNIITCVNFGDDRLRGLEVARGEGVKFCHFAYTSIVVLTSTSPLPR